ncbi:hypothetical protein O7635_31910 [Asanoa sp. WMMD1127]|uniref:hypothetical protein n=1 Tax=Asanoa sp. WMMD1127 TaxID=3016107 RepID=UPI00241771C9|nr:hypothetical protein [Asanoa sp. WMMD1127]MDG4826480.1 hypothetical protein [Asanoa sp. WMMD1127]
MLTAHPASAWRNRYDVALDGAPVTTFDGSFWKNGGAFALDGRHYEVRGSFWGNRSTLLDEMGGEVATAERIGRKRWTVTSAGRTYQFRRASVWGNRQELYTDAGPVGTVNRPSAWRRDVEVDLPGVPVAVQIFVLAVVIAMWDAQAAAAAS